MAWREFGSKQLEITQVATATTDGGTQVLAAKNSRIRAVFKNVDSSITIYLGTGTVSSSTGMPLLAGESITLHTRAAVKALAASGTPSLAIVDEFD